MPSLEPKTTGSPPTRLIVVLGMHRSGTSAITRALQVFGVGLGDRLMPALEDVNAKGFWEDLDLTDLNVEMLQAVRNEWHHVAPLTRDDLAALRRQGYHEKALELLRRKIGDSHLYGIKDPRVSKLLPFWTEIFDESRVEVSYVLQVRHPLSVVASLSRRDQFGPVKSYLLWVGYILESLKAVQGHKCAVVDFDLLMHSPEHELERISKALELPIHPAELNDYTNTFLDRGLRHTLHDIGELDADPSCPSLVREVYAALLDVATDRISVHDPALAQKLPRWEAEFRRVCASRWAYIGKMLDYVRRQRGFVHWLKRLIPAKVRVWLGRKL